MTSSHFLGTAEVLNTGTSVPCPRPSSELTPTISSRLLNRLVALTERAQRHLALAAEAQARFGGMNIAGPSCFVNDAAGGGSRSVEAARSLPAQANLR